MASRARRGRGEGTYTELKDGTWRGAISLGYRNGKRIREWVRGATKRECMEKIQELKNGGPVLADTKNITVSQYLARWLTEAAKSTVSPTTLESYENNVRLHINPAIGHLLLREVNPLHLQSLYSSMTLKRKPAKRRKKMKAAPTSGRMCQYIHSILRSAFKQAVNWGLIPTTPIARVKGPRPGKIDIHPLDENQVKPFFLAAEKERLHALFVLAILSGARAGELVALTWADVEFDEPKIRINKTLTPRGVRPPKTAKSRRTVDIPETAAKALHEHRKRMLIEGQDGKGLVFPSVKGRYLAPSTIITATRRCLAAAGLPKIRFHDLRHTHASLLLKAGVHIKVVQERLGHSTPNITLATYSHIMPSMQAQVREKMDQMFG